MTREFSADSLVTLPKLNVDSALALWQALQAGVVAEKTLPKVLLPSWQGVKSAGKELFQAAQTRLADSGKLPPVERRKADIVVDNAVGALDQLLQAWARLPDTFPQAQVAAATRQTLFPDGVGFLKLSFEQQWAQIDRRLALIKSAGLDADIAQLGGEVFLTNLEEAHKAYGQALGLTVVPEAPAVLVALRDPLAAFTSALRKYVVQVTAYADDDKPATVALSERLLRPLAAWTSKTPKSAGESETPPAPSPEPAPSPAPAA